MIAQDPDPSTNCSEQSRVFLLGGFRLEVAGRTVPNSAWLRRGSARALVKLLGVEPTHTLHREVVLDTLWPDIDRTSALNRLGKALHAARHALQAEAGTPVSDSAIRSTDGLLTLDVTRVWVDTDAFEQLAGRASVTSALLDIESALAAYTGALLPEDCADRWTHWRREALAAHYLQLQLIYGELLRERHEYTRAEQVWRTALHENPTREDIQRLLMRLYREQGELSRALRQYEMCCAAMEPSKVGAPEPETEALYQELLAERDDASTRQLRLPPSAPGQLPAPARRKFDGELVGRAWIMAALNAELRRLDKGDGGVTLVAGEPGVGKTRILYELAQVANKHRVPVVWGSASLRQHSMPYSLFVDALESYASSSTVQVRRALSELYPLLSTLIPSLIGTIQPSWKTLDPEILRGRIAAEFVSIFGRLAERDGALIVLDDLHAADAPSLELVERFIRSIGDHRWMLVIAYRSDDTSASPEFRETLATARQFARGRTLTLPRLSPQEHAELLSSLLSSGGVDPGLFEHIYTYSFGNPLYTVELVRAFLNDGSLALVDGTWRRNAAMHQMVPSRMTDLIADRLDRLGDGARCLAPLAAVLGIQFEVGVFESVAQIAFPGRFSDEDLSQALDQLLDAGLLDDCGQVYAFRQPVVRQVLLEELSSHRRAHLHGAVAAVLERSRPSDVEALAYHYSQTDQHERAVTYLRHAGERADLLLAHSAAVESYSELVRQLELLGDAAGAAEARCRLGEALLRVPRLHEAVAELERAVAIFTELDDQDNLAYATAQLAEAFYLRGSPLEGIARVLAIRERLRPTAPALSRAMLASALSSLYGAAGKYTDQLAEAIGAEQLVALGTEEKGEASMRVIAAVAHGYALMVLDRREEAVVVLRAALDAAEKVDDLLPRLRAADALAWVYEEQGEMVLQERYLETAFDAARRLNDPVRMMYMLCRRSWHFRMTGQWELAIAHLQEAHALETETGPTWVSSAIRFGLGFIMYLRGDIEHSREYLSDGLRYGTNDADPRAGAAIHRLLALCDLSDGNCSIAADRVEALLRTGRMTSDDSVRLLAVLAHARLHMGDVAGSTEAIDAAERNTGTQTPPLAVLEVLLARASIDLVSERLHTALEAVQEAIQLARKLRSPHLEGSALVVLGRIQSARGHTLEAEDAFNRSLRIFQAIGATGDVRKTKALQESMADQQRSA